MFIIVYLYFHCYVGTLFVFQVFDHISAMCEEMKQFRCKMKKKMEICTQGDLHGVLQGDSHQENDVSHASTVERLSHNHVMKMEFAMQGVAFSILYFAM